MKLVSCSVALALAGVAAFAIACADSTGSNGKEASSVTGIAGDSQVGALQHPLDFPLSLTLLGSDGQPIQGVSVSWAATPLNGAAFNPRSSVSDANGISSTSVTLGPVENTIVMTATVPGVQQPVVFHALAVHPCLFARPYEVGNTVNGQLTTTDCRATGGYYNDLLGFSPTVQTGITIDMTGNFDTWIDTYLDNGTDLIWLGFHDNIAAPTNRNSRLPIVLPPGNYIIAPNTANANVTGTYTVTSASHPASASGCELLFVTYGVVLEDNIASNDCVDGTGVGSYGDSLKVLVISGEVIKIAERSSVVDSYLHLFHVISRVAQSLPDSLELVASNNDSSAGTTNAYISHTVPGTPGAEYRLYVIFAGTNGAGQTGAYTLDISANSTLSGIARSLPRSVWGFVLGRRVIPELGLRRGL